MPSLYLAFFVTGMVTALLGPLLPVAREDWGVDDAGAGTLFAAQFLASVAGGIVSTAAAARFGARRSLAVGLLAMALGLGLLAVSTWPAVVGAPALFGLGIGLVVPEVNLLVARARPHDAAGALSLLNVTWSGGAVAWPLIVAGAVPPWPAAGPVVCVAGAAALLALGLLVGYGPSASGRPVATTVAGEGAAGRVVDGVVVPLALAFFLYGAAETAFGGWVAAYIASLGPGSSATWAAGAAAFWGALAAGRLGLPIALRWVTERLLLMGGLLVANAAIVSALATGVPAVVVAASALAGLGLAGVFPITAAACARQLGVRANALAGPLITLGGLGSAAGPWLVGVTSTATGSLRAGLGVVLAATMALLAVHAARTQADRA